MKKTDPWWIWIVAGPVFLMVLPFAILISLADKWLDDHGGGGVKTRYGTPEGYAARLKNRS